MRRNAEGELVAAAREWAVLKLGARLLGTAIERHREASQDPLLARAGELFRALTGGAFLELGSNYDEGDRPVLVGKRAGGESVTIDGLSEGTRDQLYLALRLAYVESYAAKLEPPPFIADDIFVTFDDERTASRHRSARRYRQRDAMPPLHASPPDGGDRGRAAWRERGYHRASEPAGDFRDRPHADRTRLRGEGAGAPPRPVDTILEETIDPDGEKRHDDRAFEHIGRVRRRKPLDDRRAERQRADGRADRRGADVDDHGDADAV